MCRQVVTTDSEKTSQICSRCGVIPKHQLKLQEQTFSCDACDLKLYHDMNAACIFCLGWIQPHWRRRHQTSRHPISKRRQFEPGIPRAAVRCLRDRTGPSDDWVRAGVMLTGLRAAVDYRPLEGFEPKLDHGLGEVIDRANRRFGAMSLGVGWAGMRGKGRGDRDVGARWSIKRGMLSNRATTRWDELPEARAN